MNSESSLRTFFGDLRKKRIVEILAGFIAGGWLIIEFVHFILIGHYHFPEKTLDITLITLICALLCTLIWRWFSGRESPRKFKLELVLIPLMLLIMVLLDINLLLHLKGPELESIPAAKWKNSIAVLPFENISPEEGQDYFCEGLTVELITRLSNIKELKVIAKASAYSFKGKEIDIREIGNKLNVATVLEGNVRKAGNKLRITADLINVADRFHLWSGKYDREVKDFIVIQDEISSAIVDALRLKLTTQEKKKIVEHQIDNIAAYECYLRADYEIWRMTEESIGRAIQYLQNALDTIGPNAILYSAMANAYMQYANIGVKQEDAIAKAEAYIKQALALDPDLPQAHAVLGLIYSFFRGNQQESVRHLKHALAVKPDDPDALRDLAIVYIYYVGKISAALPLVERKMRIDPLNPDTLLIHGASYVYDGRSDLALVPLRKCYQIDPENPWAIASYSYALAYNKQYDEAFSVIDQAAKTSPDNAFTKSAILLKCALQQDKEKALREMTPVLQETFKRDAGFSFLVSEAMALFGEKKESMDWLENAVNRGFINYPLLAEKDPFLANIRGEERFKKLMERVKYEWEHFEE
jgi:non-specific serine/threonine protein kinase